MHCYFQIGFIVWWNRRLYRSSKSDDLPVCDDDVCLFVVFKASVTSTQMSAVALEQENKDLIQKLARAQEERSILEEKVRHLESASSSMANDILQQYASDKRGSTSSKIMIFPLEKRKELLLF